MTREEVFKPVNGYGGKYMVSNQGAVLSLCRGGRKLLAQTDNGEGYLMVYLYKDGKVSHSKVHRLVAKEFVNGRKDGLMVNHKDGNKRNNAATNLEWVSARDNAIHAIKTGLMRQYKKIPNDKLEGIYNRHKNGEMYKEIAKDYGITGPGVKYCIERYEKLIFRPTPADKEVT